MSQVEFGEHCGFYQTYLSRLEQGHANPSLNALEVIAAAFGLTVFELFEEASTAGPTPKNKAAGRPSKSSTVAGDRPAKHRP